MLQALRSNASRQTVAKSGVVQPPVGGWDASSALAAMPGDRAVELVNFFPQPGWIEVRRGYDYQAWDIVSDTTPVYSLMTWQGQSTTSKLFAAAGTAIYDVSTEGVPSASLSGLSNAKWQWTNFTNTGNTYLVVCNGADDVRNYNGSAWSTPAITGASSSSFIGVNVHKKRLWFVQRDSTKAWYLATDAIAGAATSFELGSVFSKGGYLMAMATWTRDGGSGSDDYAVFVSSRGQVALYSGVDPGSDFALAGVFDYGAPIGRRCFCKYGSDLLLLTVNGLIPMSQTFAVDQSNQARQAITANIQQAVADAARSYADGYGWEALVYNKGTRIILNVPTVSGSVAEQYVMNTLTGAWCKFTGMNANCWVVWNDRLFFGDSTGSVFEADKGSADVATPVTGYGQCAYQSFRSPGNLKRFTMMQPLVTSSNNSRPSLGISTDFIETSEMSTASVQGTEGLTLWDASIWDVDDWSGSITQINDWVSIPAIGRFASVKFQAQTGVEPAGSEGAYWGVDVWGEGVWGGTSFASDEVMRLNGFVVLYETGGYI